MAHRRVPDLDGVAFAAMRTAQRRRGRGPCGVDRDADPARTWQRDKFASAGLVEESFGEKSVQRGGARVVSDAPEAAGLFAGELQAGHGRVLFANSLNQSC